MTLSTPVIAMITGRYRGHRVSRNPFEWLGTILFGILLIPFILLVYPVILLLTYVGLLHLGRTGNRAIVLPSGLRVFSKKCGVVGEYGWSEIELAEQRFSPPVMYPAIKLAGDRWIDLHLADFREILDACRSNGVQVVDEVKYH